VKGEIVSAKYHDGYYGTQAKMTVKILDDDGYFLVWSTIPAAITDSVQMLQELKGKTITFTANLSRGNEKHFAFAKRPSKAKLLI